MMVFTAWALPRAARAPGAGALGPREPSPAVAALHATCHLFTWLKTLAFRTLRCAGIVPKQHRRRVWLCRNLFCFHWQIWLPLISVIVLVDQFHGAYFDHRHSRWHLTMQAHLECHLYLLAIVAQEIRQLPRPQARVVAERRAGEHHHRIPHLGEAPR